jgi:hypothetical protein
MQRLDRTHIRAQLAELKLPPAALSIFDGHSLHSGLLMDSPLHVFSDNHIPDEYPILPVWEEGIIVTAYAPTVGIGHYIRFNLEEPFEDYEDFGPSFSSVVASMAIEWWELSLAREQMAHYASLFEFKDLDRVLKACEDFNQEPHALEAYYTWRKELLASCA